MAKTWKAPGTCADCGNDAYIRLGATDRGEEMVCAHCYADRIRKGGATTREPSKATPPRTTGARPQ